MRTLVLNAGFEPLAVVSFKRALVLVMNQKAFMGVMGSVGHFMMILAFARAPASTLMPFLYAQIGFAMLGGWLVFSHVPDQWSMLGMVMIAACGAAGAWLTVRESRVVLQPTET